MKMQYKYWGMTKESEEVYLQKLSNNSGIEVDVSNFGATLVNLYIPNKGKKIDIVLGYYNLESYLLNPKYFGVTVGPNCNRIENSIFSLGNKQYNLEKNDNENNLHSGDKGFQKVLWHSYRNEEENYIEFTYNKKHMELGFPGNIEAKVRYTLTENNELIINYQGISDEDTILNLTNHTYFNLSGHDNKDATNQQLWINAKHFTPVRDSKSIPTGEIRPVKNTPMDFTTMKKINEEINENYDQLIYAGGYDHNFAIDKKTPGIEEIAELYSEETDIAMEVYSDMPGVQFYSGNFISGGPIGKNNTFYENRCGICLETQFFPNSINDKNFKSPVLRKGDKYESTTIYKFILA
ncbi:MAG: aldose epimerase family protein [Romboutsia sp.]|uniref:aldose epimerase family protein n=1 Tax=Romboutsia sp. TaxID=1965302 RepID=UPI003F2BB584